MILEKPLDFAKGLAGAALEAGALAVDATLGNGRDTCFLAERVGETGRVFGFDAQPEAVARTRRRLEAAGLAGRVTLFERGHEAMRAALPPEAVGRVRAVTFNLGYLPGGDKSCITRPETTIPALSAARDVLAPGGVLTVVVYAGHPGGAEESDAVAAWAEALDQRRFQALTYRFVNQRNAPPWLLAVEKIA